MAQLISLQIITETPGFVEQCSGLGASCKGLAKIPESYSGIGAKQQLIG